MDKSDYSYKKNFDSNQIKVDSKIELENLQKILSVSSEAIVTSKEILSGEIKISGEVCFVCIYIDNENVTKSKRHLKEFETKIATSSEVSTFSEPTIKTNILDTITEQSGENQINISSIIEMKLSAITTQSFKSFEGKGYITKKSNMNLFNVIKSGETRINIEENFTLKDKPNEILSIKCNIIPRNYQAGTGYIQFDGWLIVQVIYSINRDDKIEMRSEILRRDIKEEVEIEDVTKENKVMIDINIRNCSVDYSVENQQLNLTIPADIDYIIFNNSEYEVITDGFSSTNESVVEYEEITRITKLENYSTIVTERIDGEIEIGENETRINRILSSDANRVILTNILYDDSQDKKLKIEGIVYENIIYQLDDDLGSVTSMNAEIPFILNIDTQDISKNDMIDVTCEIIDNSNRLKRGRVIEIDSELGICISVIGQENGAFVKNIESKELLQNKNDSNFIIYYAKEGEELWDICKKLRADQEIILQQNKDTSFPIREDNKMIVYYKKVNNN